MVLVVSTYEKKNFKFFSRVFSFLSIPFNVIFFVPFPSLFFWVAEGFTFSYLIEDSGILFYLVPRKGVLFLIIV